MTRLKTKAVMMAVLLSVGLTASVGVGAHHSFAAEFDGDVAPVTGSVVARMIGTLLPVGGTSALTWLPLA